MEILLVTAIAILFFITCSINFIFLGKDHWYKKLNFLFSFVFINSCLIVVSELYGINPIFKIGFIFCLFYGPFLYVLTTSISSLTIGTINRHNYFIHFYLPFIILISYVVFYSILGDKYNYAGIVRLNYILYLFIILLGSGYGTYGCLFLITNKVGNVKRLFILVYVSLLYLNSIFFISFLFFENLVIDDNIYYLLFSLTLAILLFFVCNKKFIYKFKKTPVFIDSGKNDKVVLPFLIKTDSQLIDSIISSNEIEKYRNIITRELIETKLFLNSELTLTLLSSRTKIPKAHLTYYFKQSTANGFYAYINRIRVEYSIFILKDTSELINLDEWAEASGFNSRVTFYRAFMKEKGFPPSELIQVLKVVE